jgi:hypothetical protein
MIPFKDGGMVKTGITHSNCQSTRSSKQLNAAHAKISPYERSVAPRLEFDTPT